MFRFLLTLVVSLQVALCPLLCRVAPTTNPECASPDDGLASADAHACHVAAGSCCCEPPACPSDCDSDEPAPSPACPCDCMGHVCVWTGAVVEKTCFDWLTPVTLLGRMPTPTIHLPHLAAAPLWFADAEALPIVTGRAVRALHCSLLC